MFSEKQNDPRELMEDLKNQMEALQRRMELEKIAKSQKNDTTRQKVPKNQSCDHIFENDNEYDENKNNSYSDDSDSLSSGLAELLGDENVRLSEQSEKIEEDDEIGNNSPELRRFIPSYIPERCKTIGRTPAVKLTFSQTITIGQLKAIKEKVRDMFEGLIDAEVIDDLQLNLHFGEIDESWSVLKWLQAENSENSNNLREIIPGLAPASAQYSAPPVWVSDYDGCFSIKIRIKHISRVDPMKIFSQFSRFGQLKRIYMDPKADSILVRYHEQIEAESAIVSIDRSYILGTWCRAIKAQPINGPSATKDLCEISLKEFRGKKFARADVIVSTPLSGGPIPRDNWKKLLAMASDYGEVEMIYGESEGIVVGFGGNVRAAHACVQQMSNRKLFGRKLQANKKLEIDEIK